jgi:putative hemolysin
MIAANGFFALAEMAVVSARSALLEQMKSSGTWGARRALLVATNPNEFLSTVQIGITLVGVLSGAYAGAVLADPLGQVLESVPLIKPYAASASIAIVVGSISYLSLILGELIPKRIALQHAERIACLAAPPMFLISQLFKPMVWILDFSGDALLKPFGLHEAPNRPVTAEELQHMARQGHKEGEIEKGELDLVERVFSLSDRPVRSVMTPRNAVEWLSLDADREELRTLVLLSRFSRFPVAHSTVDQPLGVVNARDLLCQLVAGGPVDLQAMMKPPVYLPDSLSAMAAIQRLRGADCAMAIVIDQYGGFQGIVTLDDLMGILMDAPLLVDSSGTELVQRKDGSWLVDGMADIHQLEVIFGWTRLPGDSSTSYHTLGGMVMAALGKIPATGEIFEWEGYLLEVLDMDGKRVDKVLVNKMESVSI